MLLTPQGPIVMPTAKRLSSSTAAAKRGAPKRSPGRKASASEVAAMEREAERLLARINKGVDEVIARADRLLARLD